MISFKAVFLGTAFALGALFAAYTSSISQAHLGFALSFVLTVVMSAQGLLFSKELETNAQATMKDREMLRYEQKVKEGDAFKYADGQVEVERPGLYTLLSLKVRLLK